MIYIETGCKKHHLTHPCFTFLLFHPSTRSRKCNFVNPPSRSKCYHVLMAATHPPVSPVEEPHQQSAFRKSQDSLINLLIVPERDKDGYCRSTDGKGKEKQSWNSVIRLHHMRQWRTWKEDKQQRKLMKTTLCFVSVVTLTRLKVEQYDSSIVCCSIKGMGEWQWCSTRLPPPPPLLRPSSMPLSPSQRAVKVKLFKSIQVGLLSLHLYTELTRTSLFLSLSLWQTQSAWLDDSNYQKDSTNRENQDQNKR